MNIRRISLSIVATTALGATGYVLFTPLVTAKDIPRQTAKQEKAYIEKKIRDQESRFAKLKPIIDTALKGNYARAYNDLSALEVEGSESFLKQKVMCLLKGDAREGLALLKAAKKNEISLERAAKLHVALAVKARDERELVFALAEWGREATYADPRSGPVQECDALMKVAISFGEDYDRETMHLLADEAIRRGSRDLNDLLNYAHCSRNNGDLRKSLKLFEKAQGVTVNSRLKKQLEGTIYDTRNIIYQFTRNRSIQEEEAARQKECREKFWARRWY